MGRFPTSNVEGPSPIRVRPWTTEHIVLYCIAFIHFYSAYHGMSLSEALPTTAIDTVSEFTRRSSTGNCK